MKLALFAENSSYGGISSYCIDLCRELQYRKCDVTLVIPLDERITNLWLLNKACEATVYYKVLKLGNGILNDIRTINVFLVNHDFDVIHTNGYRMNTLLRICRLLHPYKYRKLKHLVTVHSVLPWTISTSRQKLYSFIDSIGHVFNVHTIAVSNYTLNYVYCHSLILKNRITTIYHGIKTLKREIKKNEDCVVSFLGRLSHEKGIFFLFQIIEKYLLTYPTNKVRFEICGDGEEADCILQLQKRFPYHVIFNGFVKDVDTQLLSSDILMLTSKIETFGLVILEAMIRNVCVIATKVGGIPEIIDSGKNGILVDYGDVDSYVHFLHLIIVDSEKRKYFSENALRKVESDFSVKRSVDSYLKTLWSL